MTNVEFKQRIKEEGLETFYAFDGHKQYIDGDKVYYDGVFHNTYNVYGVYKHEQFGYAAFITDSERGLPRLQSLEKTESDAYMFLYNQIRLYKIANRNNRR